MVDVSNKHKSITVSVSSNNGNTIVAASSDTSQYWANQSHTFADQAKESVQEAKNYAELANSYIEGFEDVVTNNTNNIIATGNDYINQITELKDVGIQEINESVVSGKEEINSTKTTILNDIEFVADGEKKEIEDLIDTGKDELKEAIGDVKILTTLEIGDIGIAPLGIDETKGKRRYLNGQVIIQEQYIQFTNKVKSAVALYPSLACTESEWQTTATMTVGGQVGKFVVDNDAGTIRLPKIIMPIQGLTDLSKLGAIVEAGLPNITGKAPLGTAYGADTKFDYTNSALYRDLVNHGYKERNESTGGDLTLFDASRSNPTYGNSDTVQQEQIQYPYFIQVATGAETEYNIINEIELNNPYSFGDSKYSPVALNNLSWLKSEGQWNSKAVYPAYYDWALTNFNNGVEGFALSTGEYTDYDVVINSADETFRLPLLDGSESLPSDKFDNLTLLASDSTYTAPANGWLTFGTSQATQNGYIRAYNENNILCEQDVCNFTGSALDISIPCKKGHSVLVTYHNAGTLSYFRFVYAQGNGSLYFYVGETVQNANLINAGRIEEKIASLIPNNNTTWDGQWISVEPVTVFSSTAVGDYTVDLSDFGVPKDGSYYEVKLSGAGNTGNTGNTTLYVYSSIIGIVDRSGLYSSAEGKVGCGETIMPVAPDLILNVKIDSRVFSWTSVVLQAYRRIGTNT